MRKTVLLAFSVIFVFLHLLVSCSKKDLPANLSSSDRQIKIGFSIDTLIVERWKQDCEIFNSTAKKNGAIVSIMDAANSVQTQISQIDSLIGQKVDVIVIVPKEASSMSAVVLKAKAKKIPVIAYDRLILNVPIDLYVSVDCEKVGILMAKRVASELKKGSCWSILGSKEDYNMTMIETGIYKGLSGTKIPEVYKYFTPDWNYDLSYRKMSSLFAQGLVPDGIICGNDAIAETVLRAISEQRLGKTIPVVGQDADVLACRRIVSGLQDSTVYKPIGQLASIAAEYACCLARGCEAEDIAEVSRFIDNGARKVPSVLLEPVLVTKENINQVIIDSGFHTFEEIYR